MQQEQSYDAIADGFTFFGFDPMTNTTTFFKTNEDGSTTLYAEQNIEALVEENEKLFNESQGLKHSDWQLIARPGNLAMQQLGLSKAIEQKDRK